MSPPQAADNEKKIWVAASFQTCRGRKSSLCSSAHTDKKETSLLEHPHRGNPRATEGCMEGWAGARWGCYTCPY